MLTRRIYARITKVQDVKNMINFKALHIYIMLPLFVTLKKVYGRNVVNKYRIYLLHGVIIINLIDYIYIRTKCTVMNITILIIMEYNKQTIEKYE